VKVLTRASALVIAVVLLLVAAACGDDDDVSSGSTTTTRETTSSSASSSSETTGGGSTSTTAASGGQGCTGGPQVPTGPGVGSGPIVDVDGDGRKDIGWLAAHRDGSRELGVALAAGGSDAVRIESASPSALTLLVVDADERPPVEVFVSDNRTVQLWAFADCQLAPVTNPQHDQYLFDLGFRGTGTGVGCRDTSGGRQLVGLNVTDDNSTVVDWTRTVIERDGLTARNGPTDEGQFRRPGDDAAIELLHTVSCGDLTIARDGIRQPEL
jgi:hypothetical protein